MTANQEAERSRIDTTLRRGPVAQGLEQSAHNRSVGGSIPSGPTKFVSIRAQLAGSVHHLPLWIFMRSTLVYG